MSEIETKHGKIESIYFGLGGYQDAQLGVHVSLSGSGWGVGSSGPSTWDPESIPHSDHCRWSEQDRDDTLAKGARWLSKLLKDAKVDRVDKLKGKPVVCEFEGQMLKSWRIFTEVL